MPAPLCDAEGNSEQGANRKPCNDPARSEAPSMSGSLLPRSWEGPELNRRNWRGWSGRGWNPPTGVRSAGMWSRSLKERRSLC